MVRESYWLCRLWHRVFAGHNLRETYREPSSKPLRSPWRGTPTEKQRDLLIANSPLHKANPQKSWFLVSLFVETTTTAEQINKIIFQFPGFCTYPLGSKSRSDPGSEQAICVIHLFKRKWETTTLADGGLETSDCICHTCVFVSSVSHFGLCFCGILQSSVVRWRQKSLTSLVIVTANDEHNENMEKKYGIYNDNK